MTITHIVSFSVSSLSTLPSIAAGFLALPKTCLHPSTGKPYILSAKGGKQNSPEGKDRGMQVVFIMEFANEEDRKYYLDTDPAHDEFKNQAMGEWGVTDAVVLDFTGGTF